MKRPSGDDGGKRPPRDDDGDEYSSDGTSAEELARRFMQKYPRFFLYCAIGLGVLIVIAVIVAKFSGPAH